MTNQENKVNLGVALLPPAEIRALFCSLVSTFFRSIEWSDQVFFHDCKQHLHHLTLFQGMFDQDDVPQIQQILEKISDSFNQIVGVCKEFSIQRRYLTLLVKDNPNLASIHQALIDQLFAQTNPLLITLTEEYHKFGLKYDFFDPHITLVADEGLLQKDHPENVLPDLKPPLPIPFTELVLAELNSRGGLEKIIWQKSLSLK